MAKLIRVALSPLPVSHAQANASAASSSEATSRMTVFIVPPLYFVAEIRQQLSGIGKRYRCLHAADMLVIALACLVIKAQHAN
ncbi:MAG: hypothetical protein LBQ20_06670 [Rhodanobacter sp.]|nr:hypothetical protein [Rhodanobacter sp.]